MWLCKDTKLLAEGRRDFPIRRFNYQMQLNWFRLSFDKKAVWELGR